MTFDLSLLTHYEKDLYGCRKKWLMSNCGLYKLILGSNFFFLLSPPDSSLHYHCLSNLPQNTFLYLTNLSKLPCSLYHCLSFPFWLYKSCNPFPFLFMQSHCPSSFFPQCTLSPCRWGTAEDARWPLPVPFYWGDWEKWEEPDLLGGMEAGSHWAIGVLFLGDGIIGEGQPNNKLSKHLKGRAPQVTWC